MHVVSNQSLPKCHEFHAFLRLSRELRLIIWSLTFEEQLGEIRLRDFVSSDTKSFKCDIVPSFCYISKQTLEEVVAVVIQGSQFMVASITDNELLHAFLGAAPGRFRLCRQLNFDYFGRFPENLPINKDLKLAVACSGLLTIKLTFHADAITSWVRIDGYEDGMTRHPCTADYIFSKYKLNRPLDCNKLRKIIIQSTGSGLGAAKEAAEELGQMLEHKFVSKPMKQEVYIEYTRKAQYYYSYFR